MTTVHINLPDEVPRDAQTAGRIMPEVIEQMLRARLRRRAGEELRAMWQRLPADELAPAIEQEIVEEVRASRD